MADGDDVGVGTCVKRQCGWKHPGAKLILLGHLLAWKQAIDPTATLALAPCVQPPCRVDRYLVTLVGYHLSWLKWYTAPSSPFFLLPVTTHSVFMITHYGLETVLQ